MNKSEEIQIRRKDIEKKIEMFRLEYERNKSHLLKDLKRLQSECDHKNKAVNRDFVIPVYDCPDCGKKNL